jgi:protein ImuB
MSRILCIKLDDSVTSVETLQAVAARSKQFTPLVGIDPDVFPESVLLDITRVLDLFGGEAALVERITGELQAEGWRFRAAVAETCGAAWALAGFGTRGEEERERRECDTQYSVLSTSPLSSFPFSLTCLPLPALRLPEPIIALLHSLGVWRIEQLQALPRRELSSRFGPELLDCLDRVTGRLPEPLPAWEPPPQFEVCWSAEYPTARQEMIDAALEHLARRLADMLTRAGRGAMRLECRLTCLGEAGGAPAQRVVEQGAGRQTPGSVLGAPCSFSVGLFRPTAWANHLLQLLQVRLESLRLPGPVETIRLTAITAPLELRQQEMFTEKTRVQSYHLSGLIDRLSNRLGHTRVARVRLIPEAQPELACRYAPLVSVGWRQAQRRPTKDVRSTGFSRNRNGIPAKTGTTSARPVRLLAEPLRLPDINAQFSFAGRLQCIVRRIGPERIETGWWRGKTIARDYYRAETAAGCWYWIFRRLPHGPWFLHGMFD